MKDEYVIINKTALLKRIEELEKVEKELINLNMSHSTTRGKIDELISVVHQSTPLIPEIEKAYDAGTLDKEFSQTFDNVKGRYIGFLKLDI